MARAVRRVLQGAVAVTRAKALGLLPPPLTARRTLDALRADAGWVPPDALELIVRLNAAARGLRDDDRSNRWLHYRWVSVFEEMFDAVEDGLVPRLGFDAVSFGAGSRNPLALPLLLFLGGARRVHVVEPELGPTTADWRLRWGLQEIVLRVLTGDVCSRHFVRAPAEIEAFVDLRALFFGTDTTSALRPDGARVLDAYLEDCQIPPATIGLVTSRSVLEHVTHTGRCFDALAAMVKSGGIMYHDVDLTAHDDGDPFAFYYAGDGDDGARRPDGLNGLRLGDYLDAFARRGFDSRVVKRELRTDYRLDRSRLLERFRGYGDDDLRCARAVIVSRRRG